jgi:hypothetical protein
MEKLVTMIKALVAAAVIVAAGVLVGWWGTGGKITIAEPRATSALPSSEPSPHETPLAPLPSPPQQRQAPSTRPKPAPAPRIASTSDLITNWQERVDSIVGSQLDSTLKADQLLQLYPRLPQDGQIEAAQFASNLIPDTNYNAVGTLLTNAETPEPVLDVLLAGLLTRPDAVKLPYLLQVARDPANSKAEQARLYLQTYLEHDYGNNWSEWQASVDRRTSLVPQ